MNCMTMNKMRSSNSIHCHCAHRLIHVPTLGTVSNFRQRVTTYSSNGSTSGGPPSSRGDSDLQESLVDMLQVQLAKAKVKEDILSDLEKRKENIRQIGQELTEEFEKKVELDKMRMELASSTSLADTLDKFKELDDEIQGIRDQLQADQADLDAFEARSASQRNDSLFFKQLYKGPPTDKDSGKGVEGSTDNPAVNNKVLQQVSTDIKQPAAKELASPMRLYISTYLTLVLVYVVASDIGQGMPNLALDGLYILLATGLGWNAWNERQALIQQQLGGNNDDTQNKP